ncbi:hypothetical protein CEUSTIGMA_g6593.t1 [Chlamydomonas eustigma]|uniref:VASt domain-containing protein n=1 Tax=Chlamydomonas eustigma TaxID=1157962 RepID=A0A250X7V5_9CHLO|nr:hypothetical protein CEUSTIGMA_g6593.t1 [Chlamydomonas eustigma]|eukprot:GAX79153.1 hypothetical protein CEUSTIGMA_g6593.t1 [Chlamydomonas eustigma]
MSPVNQRDDGGDEEEDQREEDEGPVPPPITLPPPLSVMVTEVTVGARPTQVFVAVFKEDSTYRAKMMAKEELRNVVTNAFADGPELVASNGIKAVKSRTVTYIRPLNIPMAPKQCDVTEEHALITQEAGGFVVESKVTTNAPKGDTFYVLIQWAGIVEGSKTRVRISLEVVFIKSVGFLKSIIESGAVSSTKKLMQAWADELVAQMSPLSQNGKGKKRVGQGAVAVLDTVHQQASSTKGSGHGGMISLDTVGGKVLVVLCIFIAWILGTSLWQASASFNKLAAALFSTQRNERHGENHEVIAEQVAAAVIDLLIKASKAGK